MNKIILDEVAEAIRGPEGGVFAYQHEFSAEAAIEALRPHIVNLVAEHLRPGLSDPQAVAGRFVDRMLGEAA